MKILETVLPMTLVVLVLILIGFILYKILEPHFTDEKVMERNKRNQEKYIKSTIKQMSINPYSRIISGALLYIFISLFLIMFLMFVKYADITALLVVSIIVIWPTLSLTFSSTISYFLYKKNEIYFKKAISMGAPIPGTIVNICDDKHNTDSGTYYEYYFVIEYCDPSTGQSKKFLTPKLSFNPHEFLGSESCSVYIYKDVPFAHDFIPTESIGNVEPIETDNTYLKDKNFNPMLRVNPLATMLSLIVTIALIGIKLLIN